MIKRFMFFISLVAATIILSVPALANDNYPIFWNKNIIIIETEYDKSSEPLPNPEYINTQESDVDMLQ